MAFLVSAAMVTAAAMTVTPAPGVAFTLAVLFSFVRSVGHVVGAISYQRSAISERRRWELSADR